MKKIVEKSKRLFSLFAAVMFLAGGVFLSCSSDDDGGGEEGGSGKSGPESADVTTVTAGSEVTVNVGESITVYAAGKTKAESGETDGYPAGLTVTAAGDGNFTITADSTMNDTSTTVNLNDGSDSDEGIDVTVYVYNPVFTVNLTLSDELAKEAASISIYYEGKEDSESSASLYDTVQAVYTAGATTATASFQKEKANSYKYFNNIAVTVKDASENEIQVSINPTYFCYTDTTFTGISLEKTISSQTFKITFDGFTIKGGSVEGLKYSNTWASSSSEWNADNITSPTVTVADDGTYATFPIAVSTLTDKSELYIDWTAVAFKDADGNDITDSYDLSGNTASNQWYSYSDTEKLVITITGTSKNETFTTLLDGKSVEVSTADTYAKVLEASVFTGLTLSKLKVTINSTDGTWASISGASTWAEGTYTSNAINTTQYISDTAYLNAIKTNGLYIQTSTGIFTVTVEYN